MCIRDREFIVCTEEGVGYKLKTQNLDKTFYYPDRLPVCPNMKKNTLEKILHVLKTGENEVHVSDALRENSKKPLEKMLEPVSYTHLDVYKRQRHGRTYRRRINL